MFQNIPEILITFKCFKIFHNYNPTHLKCFNAFYFKNLNSPPNPGEPITVASRAPGENEINEIIAMNQNEE